MKKLLLSLCLLMGCATLHAATETVDGITWTYQVSSGKAKIYKDSWSSAIPSSTSGAITIPSTLGGYPVTSIGNSAFYECFSLTSVTIPEGVTEIGDSAFFDCSNLWKDANGVQYESAAKVVLIDVPESLAGEFVIPNSVRFIHSSAFLYCSSLTSVTIPSSVTSIGYEAFYSCSSLTSVTILEGVTSIGNSAFSWCSSLTSVTIPEGVTSIGNEAFGECSSLTSVTIPESVTSIGDDAFSDCSNLWKDANGVQYESAAKVVLIDVPESLAGEFVIPNSVRFIHSSAFSDCSSLTSVTIPSSVTSIGEYAFYYCSSLTSVTIPEGVTSIGDYAFYECSSLTSVTIPEGVTSIGNSAFYECSSLTSVTIPKSVVSIGYAAFHECSLQYVYFEGAPPRGINREAGEFGNPFDYSDEDLDLQFVSCRAKYRKEWEMLGWGDPWVNVPLVVHDVAVSINTFGGGKITTSAEDGIVDYLPKGETRRLKAVPADGYVFMGWSGDVISTENEIEISGDVEEYHLNVQFLPKSLLSDFIASNGGSSGTGGATGGLSKAEVVSAINEVVAEMLKSGSLISADEAGKVVDQKMEEKQVVTQEQIDDLAMETPVIDMTKGKGTLSLSLKKASSLSEEDWKNVSVENPTVDVNGNIKVELSLDEEEKAAFYKFVVPTEQ